MSMWSSHIPNLDFIPVLPVLCGREGEDEGESGQPGEGGTGAGEQKSEGGNAEDAGEKGKETLEGNPQAKITAQQEIIDRLDAQRKEKDTELEELRKFRKDADEAKLSEQERIDKRVKELEESNTAKDATLQKLVVKQAFSSVDGIDWHDAGTALSLIDLSGFEIVNDEKTGTPEVKDQAGFKAAVQKLAKDKPFLVKTPDEGEKPKPQAWEGKKTGSTPAPKATADQAERDRLKKKFPALRNRG